MGMAEEVERREVMHLAQNGAKNGVKRGIKVLNERGDNPKRLIMRNMVSVKLWRNSYNAKSLTRGVHRATCRKYAWVSDARP